MPVCACIEGQMGGRGKVQGGTIGGGGHVQGGTGSRRDKWWGDRGQAT